MPTYLGKGSAAIKTKYESSVNYLGFGVTFRIWLLTGGGEGGLKACTNM